MSNLKPYDDAVLVAYLDGQLDADAMAKIEADLHHNLLLAERVRALDLDTKALKDAFSEITKSAPPIASQTFSPPTGLPFWKMGIAACALIAAGLAGAYFFPQTRDDWTDIAAAYHQLYVTKTLAHIDRPDAIVSAELKRISAPLGLNITRQDIDIKGLIFKRGQILGFRKTPLIHLAYLTPNGTPVAFCILNKRSEPTREMISAKKRGLSSEHWSDGQFEYLLIGDVDSDILKAMANRIAERFANL